MKKEVLKKIVEIMSISISLLRGRYHREFIFDVLGQAEACEAVVENLAGPLAALKEAAEHERQLAMKGEPSELIERLNTEADAREKAQTALKAGFRAMMGMEDAQVKADAEKLFNLAHDYDIHAGDDIDGQTDDIRSFINDVEANYMDQLERVGMVALFNILKAKNELVCDLRVEADKANAGREDGRMAKARQTTDEAYRLFVNAVNVFAHMQGEAGYADFIGYMNALIIRYKRTHLHQSASTPEATPEVPDETTPPSGGDQQPDNTPDTNPDDTNQGDNSQGGGGSLTPDTNPPSGGDNTGGDNNNTGGGGNTNPGGGYVPPSNGGGFD